MLGEKIGAISASRRALHPSMRGCPMRTVVNDWKWPFSGFDEGQLLLMLKDRTGP
ncbi:hypothetical protein LJR178_004265 [Variovorax sp. LjRoot178]